MDRLSCYVDGALFAINPFADTTSMAVMAMSCMKPTFNNINRLESLKSMIRKGTKCILNNQDDDGGFGSYSSNVISTALAAQVSLICFLLLWQKL